MWVCVLVSSPSPPPSSSLSLWHLFSDSTISFRLWNLLKNFWKIPLYWMQVFKQNSIITAIMTLPVAMNHFSIELNPFVTCGISVVTRSMLVSVNMEYPFVALDIIPVNERLTSGWILFSNVEFTTFRASDDKCPLFVSLKFVSSPSKGLKWLRIHAGMLFVTFANEVFFTFDKWLNWLIQTIFQWYIMSCTTSISFVCVHYITQRWSFHCAFVLTVYINGYT